MTLILTWPKVEGTLTDKNAGGNCTYPTFMVNPQYHLRIHPAAKTDTTRGSKKSKTKVVLRTAKGVPVNVVVVWSKGDRKFEYVFPPFQVNGISIWANIDWTSKKWRVAQARIRMVSHKLSKTSSVGISLQPTHTYVSSALIRPAGDYTLIVSAFEPYHTGPYTLRVECSTPFDVKSIPQEGSGLRTKVVKDTWDASCAAGGPSFQKYAQNPRFEFTLPTSGQIKQVILS